MAVLAVTALLQSGKQATSVRGVLQGAPAQHREMQRRPSVKYMSSIGAWCVSFLVDRNLVCQSTQDFLICRLTCLAVLFARAPAVVFCAVRMAFGT